MGINLGKWSDAENNLLLAGATNELIMKRTGRTLNAIVTARSKMGIALGRRIKPVPEGRFLAEERSKIREMKRNKVTVPQVVTSAKLPHAMVSPVETERRPRRIVSIDKARAEGWKPLPSGAGVVCLKGETPAKKVILRDNIIRHKGTMADQNTPLDPKVIHVGAERKTFARVEPEVKDPKLDEALDKMDGIDALIETQKAYAPSKDELFFEVNGTRVTVASGTKKVDIMPYGLIIEF